MKEHKNILLIVFGVLILACIIAGTIIIVKKIDDDHYENILEELSHDDSNTDAEKVEENIPNGNDTNSTIITRQDALNIVLKSLNIKEKDIYDLDIELDNKYNTRVYEIDFNYQKYEYEYYVNAVDGTILKSFKEIDR